MLLASCPQAGLYFEQKASERELLAFRLVRTGAQVLVLVWGQRVSAFVHCKDLFMLLALYKRFQGK